MRTLQFTFDDVRNGHLLVVNQAHSISRDIPQNQLSSTFPLYPHILLEQQTAKMLVMLFNTLPDMDEIVPVSGYRSMSEQRSIYLEALQEHGESYTKQYVAFPGCSEHQTGLAIDLAANQANIDFLTPAFPNIGMCKLFRERAHQYGFIERYGHNKTHITGIAHEPWHYRYVGYPHSELMYEHGFALEEYTAYLKQFTYPDNPLQLKWNQRHFSVFYVAVQPDTMTTIEIPDSIPFQVSGNNMDGVVVTLWMKS